MRKEFFILLVIVFLFSCADYVQIRSFTLKVTNKEVYSSIELNNDTAASILSNRIGKGWVAKLKKTCDKYDIYYSYAFLNDSTNFILKLNFKDMNYVSAFLFDMNLKSPLDTSDFPLNLRFSNTVDSVFVNLKIDSKIFSRSSYISIETPTDNPYFYPFRSSKYLTIDRVAPNKMDYYLFYTDTLRVVYDVLCKFKKNELPVFKLDTNKFPASLKKEDVVQKKDSVIQKDEGINFLGMRQKYWEFWCVVIGGIASIIAIVSFFKEKKK